MVKTDITKSTAIKFIILMGVVSFFADMTYEGARSITGPYLAVLGASAAIVGFVAGLGEFLGYALRLASGYLTDKTHRYWLITILGYSINLLAVPLLAFTSSWQMASLLIVAERAGKGIRNPARDTMLSHAAHRMGMGWGFGLHEAMDQAGAMLGPLLITLILFSKNDYQHCFAFLLFPALASLSVLFSVKYLYPLPQVLEPATPAIQNKQISKKSFWFYLMGASCVAFGYADFALIAFHFEKIKIFSASMIPAMYALALGVNIIMAPLLGYWYDKQGFVVLMIMTFLASFFPPLIFWGSTPVVLFGIVLWGIGIGAQGSLMRAIIANMISKEKRGTAYGLFNFMFGFAWFLGSTAIGILYDISLTALILFSMGAQLLGLLIFSLMN